ncbi:MAG TPA: metallopeptidase TldD-related protein [Candidatus Dormibacteraeota bacterium]|nr:metallopeptidase TldD-related protein [Candidatus Dormibacteraeota bacterium]
MKTAFRFAALTLFSLALNAATFGASSGASSGKGAQQPNDNDQTLRAMRDEMARAKTRLELKIPGTEQPVRPYYVEYRLLDLDIREVVAEFGTLLNTTRTRNRFMNVEARVGDYKHDSSNFVSDDGFRGFIGPTGSVGIDRDYNSLRQDLWIATDQAFKEAVETYSRKQAYLNSLARQSDIDDFSKAEPMQLIEPLAVSDWSSRNWEQEARDASAGLRAFPQIYEARVTYYLVYATEYLLTSEGTEIRQNRRFAAIEAGMDTLADDGTPLNHLYTAYAPRPADLPDAETVRKNLNVCGTELMALRGAPATQDYTGPVLFEARAAAPLLAQVLGPAVNGARPPVSFTPVMEQMLAGLGGKSDWITRLGARVLPTSVTLVDDPTAKDFDGKPLLGGYNVDDEGVHGQKVTLVENGTLKGELMSRRPGPDFDQSNGHGRAAFLNDAKPTMSNLLFTSSETVSAAELRTKFLESCRAEKLNYCLIVRQMDNPAISFLHQEDFSELLASFGGGAGTGDRLPLVVYRVYPADGREEIVRGMRVIGLSTRSLRNIAGIGNDNFVYNYMQSQVTGFTGTALGAFGSAQTGIPASIVAPSLYFEEVEVHGSRGEPKRLPLLPAPVMTAK